MTAATSPGRFSLRCGLGWHAPESLACWNDGYYFARCRRCGLDLVRTAYGRWHGPRGFRVVWRPERPENAPSAELLPSPEPETDSPAHASGEELPIQEVLRHLQQSEVQTESAPVKEPGYRPRTYVPDFMDDARTDTSWRTNRPSRWPPSAPTAARVQTAAETRIPAESRLSELVARIRDLVAVSAARFGAANGETRRNTMVALAVIVLLSLVLAITLWGRGSPPAREAPPAPAPMPVTGPIAFVTAEVLNCRAGPAPEAERVARLQRGDAVSLIALDGDWASVSYAGGQCWALRRFMSMERPMALYEPGQETGI
jgi:hypothetical protein